MAYIGLGSNVGDRLAHLRRAVVLLETTPGFAVTGVSSVYDTESVGPPQPNFLNAVVRVETAVSARELLERLKQIQREMGRTEGERWGPREIDLDLLVHGEDVVDEPDLVVPHPELANRAFVLVPLVDIDPEIRIPSRGTAADLLAGIGTAGINLTAHALR